MKSSRFLVSLLTAVIAAGILLIPSNHLPETHAGTITAEASTAAPPKAKHMPWIPVLLLGDSETYTIVIAPQSLLFTEPGQTSQLTATVYDKDGQEVDRTVKWSSSNPQAVTVDEDGIITSSVWIGSATITASFGTSVSNTVTVLAADPAEGAVLVSDDQVVGEVTPVDPDAPLGVGVRVNVRLSGITPPASGTVVLGTGEQPVGGKVVSAVQAGDDVELVLEAIPLDEMFDELVIDEEIDLSREVPTIAQIFADNYDVNWTPGGSLDFTLRKTAQSSALASSTLMSSTGVPMGTQVLNPNANHGPFNCEAGFTTPFVLDGFPVSLSVTPSLAWNLSYDSNQGGLQSLLLFGGVTGTYKVANTFTAALGGKVSCTTKLGEIPIPLASTGALSALALYVPLGVGFDVEGKITLLQVGFELTTEAKAIVFVGVQCPGGSNCSMITNLDTDVKDEFKWITPDVSTTPLQILSQFRLEPAVSGYLSSGLDLGFIPQLHIPARAKLLKAKAGVKLAGNFALVEGQMADAGYSSNYLLSHDSVLGAGLEFNALGGLFHADIFKTEIKLIDPLAESPKVLEAVSDVKDFVTGDSVTFTVSLDPHPQHINFPIVGYNVAKVSIYRRTEDDVGGVGPANLLAEVVPADGVVDVQMTWTADVDGTIDGDYFAFVETKALPFPYFGELEVATVTAGSLECDYRAYSDATGTGYQKSCRNNITGEDIYLNQCFGNASVISPCFDSIIFWYNDVNTVWGNHSNVEFNGDCFKKGIGWTVYATTDTERDVHQEFISADENIYPESYIYSSSGDTTYTTCWPDKTSVTCGTYACPDSIIPLVPFPGDCHVWWDHFDSQGIWQECSY